MIARTVTNKKFNVWTDGGARGNPGIAGIGIVVKDEHDNLVFEMGKSIGHATNNIAEYAAVLEALKYLNSNFSHFKANFFLDSELVTKQLNGEYKVKDVKLKELYLLVKREIFEANSGIEFKHIRREENERADELYNMALDKS